jgi:hypothetical protein
MVKNLQFKDTEIPESEESFAVAAGILVCRLNTLDRAVFRRAVVIPPM